MKAILLAAGVGKRMGPDALPKCLLSVGGRTLLQLTLDGLRSVGVRDVVMVVGYRKEEVAREARKAGGIRLAVVENPRYQEGAILSLWTARGHLDGDVLVMDADVLCPPIFFERLVHSSRKNCLLADGSVQDTGEEQIVMGEGGRVLHITKRPAPQDKERMASYGESVGFLKLSREAAVLLKEILDKKVGEGAVSIEHEQVYPELFRRVEVGFEPVNGLPWLEIDTPEDLRRAAEQVFPRWNRPHHINRRLSNLFLPWVLRLPLTPNQWTSLSLLCGLLAVWMIGRGGYAAGLAGAALFQLFYVMDNWDGDVARVKGLSSYWGGWFDVAVDGIIQAALPLGLAAGLQRDAGFRWAMPLGWVAALGLALDFAVTYWAKFRGFGPGVVGDPSRSEWRTGSPLPAWVQANMTHENFSLLLVLVLVLDLRAPFLWVLAAGAHFFWIQYLWGERRRLL